MAKNLRADLRFFLLRDGAELRILIVSKAMGPAAKTKSNMNTIRITAHAHLGYRPWLARITGTDSKYGLSRDFLRPTEYSRSRSGRTDDQTWEIDVGLYQRGGTKRDDGLFIVWRKDGQLFRTTVDMARAQAIARLLDEGEDFETARKATKPTKEASAGHA